MASSFREAFAQAVSGPAKKKAAKKKVRKNLSGAVVQTIQKGGIHQLIEDAFWTVLYERVNPNDGIPRSKRMKRMVIRYLRYTKRMEVSGDFERRVRATVGRLRFQFSAPELARKIREAKTA